MYVWWPLAGPPWAAFRLSNGLSRKRKRGIELLDAALAAQRWTWELLYNKRRKAYDFHMAPLCAPRPAPAAEER
jgi:hypothetical protein